MLAESLSWTEWDLRHATHEAAHAAAAVLLGRRVDWVSIDRDALVDHLGECYTSFADGDDRPLADKAADRAVQLLAAVLVEPGRGHQSDPDLRTAYMCAGITGTADPDAWISEQSDRAAALIAKEEFRLLLDALSYALLAERTLDAARVREVVAEVLAAGC